MVCARRGVRERERERGEKRKKVSFFSLLFSIVGAFVFRLDSALGFFFFLLSSFFLFLPFIMFSTVFDMHATFCGTSNFSWSAELRVIVSCCFCGGGGVGFLKKKKEGRSGETKRKRSESDDDDDSERALQSGEKGGDFLPFSSGQSHSKRRGSREPGIGYPRSQEVGQSKRRNVQERGGDDGKKKASPSPPPAALEKRFDGRGKSGRRVLPPPFRSNRDRRAPRSPPKTHSRGGRARCRPVHLRWPPWLLELGALEKEKNEGGLERKKKTTRR